MNKRELFLKEFTKWALLGSALFLCAVLQATPGMLQIFGVKPYLILTLCLCVALQESAAASATFALFGGLLWDISAGRLVGFFALVLCAVCFAATILTKYYANQSLVNAALIVFAAAVSITLFDITVNATRLFTGGFFTTLSLKILPSALMSALLAPLFYLLVQRIKDRYMPRRQGGVH